MSDRSLTDQEQFWQGQFGTDYTERNSGSQVHANAVSHIARQTKRITSPIQNVVELGANRGRNIAAMQTLLPDAEITAVEINPEAAALLGKLGCTVENCAILDWQPDGSFDLVYVSGVLIHINPDDLPATYEKIASAAGKYVVLNEYYNPVPTQIDYRGHDNRLFKRDFAGEFLDAHPEFILRDYGFIYHRDTFPGDDTTWFLLERS